MDDYDHLGVGRMHGEPGGDPDTTQGDVRFMRTAEGRGVMLPVSVRRLRGESLEAAARIQGLAAEIGRLQYELAESVADGRDLGLSWGVVGWSVGTTSEAARQRWGIDRD